MKTLVFIFVISGTLIAIASGIWVAIELGNAISKNKGDNAPDDSVSNSKAE